MNQDDVEKSINAKECCVSLEEVEKRIEAAVDNAFEALIYLVDGKTDEEIASIIGYDKDSPQVKNIMKSYQLVKDL